MEYDVGPTRFLAMNVLNTATRTMASRIESSLRQRRSPSPLSNLPGFAVPASSITILPDPAAFRHELLNLIGSAKRRIVIVVLYLQDDDGGREIMDALYAARARQPQLQISLFVDWHRAQRGLIGNDKCEGNAGMYREYAERHGPGVAICGVPVQSRELFGVLHLKGIVIDDTLLYSGASLNDVYLNWHGRYRLDRYHSLKNAGLADALADFVQQHLADSPAVRRLNDPGGRPSKTLQSTIRGFREALRDAHYRVPSDNRDAGQVLVTPLLGFGRTDNALNDVVLALLDEARESVVLLTPYFNMPGPMRKAIGQLLRRGCRVDIMVGDKTANDFYLAPDQPFTTIGMLPYLYENNLRRFAHGHRRHIESGQLKLWLWRDGENSYHLKGMFVDDDVSLLTGHNLNPRAWARDLENGLLLRDPERLLAARNAAEWEALKRHATRLTEFHSLDSPRDYPAQVRKKLKQLTRTRIDRLVNRLM